VSEPVVAIPVELLSDLVIYTGPDRPAYVWGMEILLNVDYEKGLRALSFLYCDYTPDIARHVIEQMGIDPAVVTDELACLGCGVNVVYMKEQAYMVHNDVWAAAGLTDGWACVGCLEERLGRELTPDDFGDFFSRDPLFERSERLTSRIEGRP